MTRATEATGRAELCAAFKKHQHVPYLGMRRTMRCTVIELNGKDGSHRSVLSWLDFRPIERCSWARQKEVDY